MESWTRFGVIQISENCAGGVTDCSRGFGSRTPEVHALRRDCGFPGMKVLQFAFYNDPQHPFYPTAIVLEQSLIQVLTTTPLVDGGRN